jgi:hypothetical protein
MRAVFEIEQKRTNISSISCIYLLFVILHDIIVTKDKILYENFQTTKNKKYKIIN